MSEWEKARDEAAEKYAPQDGVDSIARSLERGAFTAGWNEGRVYEAKRAEALTKLATAAVNLWRASQVGYSPTLLAQLELTMHNLYEALAAYKGET